MVKKLSVAAFLSSEYLSKDAISPILNEHDITDKIKSFINLVKTHTLISIDEKQYKNSITTANNIYFYSLDPISEDIVNEYMLLTEAILDIKKINPHTYRIITEQSDKSITIRIHSE